MKCPRCGGDMSSGICKECGFPTIGRKFIGVSFIVYSKKKGL